MTDHASTESVCCRIFNKLRDKIIRLELTPGSAIPEASLATELEVPETIIREALIMLGEHEFVDFDDAGAPTVRPVDLDQVKEFQCVREALELYSLQTIKLPLDAKRVADLRINLAEQEKITATNPAAFFDLDEEYHRLLMGLAGHEESWETAYFAKAHLDRARMLGGPESSPPRRYYLQHLEIFQSIMRGDLDVANAMLRDHLRIIVQEIQGVYDHRPEHFAK